MAVPSAQDNEEAEKDDVESPDKVGRSSSPPASPEFSRPSRVVGEMVMVEPGVGSVPEMPGVTSRDGAVRLKAQGVGEQGRRGPGQDWDWPEDIF